MQTEQLRSDYVAAASDIFAQIVNRDTKRVAAADIKARNELLKQAMAIHSAKRA